ncbi:hypothetical protein Ciccas_006631 [Cichlidogyrus casuarinus]|uniref:peptidylglycine monooxygenase n=1 Tax=Cichlidogyrus casuarinus TaxID=1844966 RepID=A0ABD2Q7M0_9PLAT
MPGAQPTRPDQYICARIPYTSSEPTYITGFIPRANFSVVHHMMLLSCHDPVGLTEIVSPTSCDMPCVNIIYVWANNAPQLELPTGVSFAMGPGTDIQSLVFQIHYKSALAYKDSFTSIELRTSPHPTPRSAGVYLLYANEGRIPPDQDHVNIDLSCKFDATRPITVFAMRTHAHALGRAVSGYLMPNGGSQLQFLGRGNPQWPQAFYSPKQLDDVIMARCMYDSKGMKRTTSMGSTHEDEMCNLYLMFHTRAGDMLSESQTSCGSNNYPQVWSYAPADASDYASKTMPSSSQMRQERENPKISDRSAFEIDLVLEEERTSQNISAEQRVFLKYALNWNVIASNMQLGQVSDVGFLAPNSLLVLHRGSNVWDWKAFNSQNLYTRPSDRKVEFALLIVEPTSGVVQQRLFNDTFLLPHSFTFQFDTYGQPTHIWFTDVALHQALRFPWTPSNFASKIEPDLVLGTRSQPGTDRDHFCQPSSVALAPDVSHD